MFDTYRPAHLPGAPRRRLARARQYWERTTFRLPPHAQADVGYVADREAPAAVGTAAWYEAAARAASRR